MLSKLLNKMISSENNYQEKINIWLKTNRLESILILLNLITSLSIKRINCSTKRTNSSSKRLSNYLKPSKISKNPPINNS